ARGENENLQLARGAPAPACGAAIRDDGDYPWGRLVDDPVEQCPNIGEQGLDQSVLIAEQPLDRRPQMMVPIDAEKMLTAQLLAKNQLRFHEALQRPPGRLRRQSSRGCSPAARSGARRVQSTEKPDITARRKDPI